MISNYKKQNQKFRFYLSECIKHRIS